ncbi:CDP-alcohol phosphatidyltransferase family protein [Jeotgalibaca caeni]|uniref:CDP-alcohol phosphatidyltransferase family protein n=1 Tax=Jeotgalibaca caeni TaxID=3028623 RepID=UPI00237E0F94|nr:CDP-alcohol phosphatidyltransferase family protein [Jeotgalibaca caeni]MDE1549443.1 CDP-alcohol phosphatidyltransferase family protein [Jeotgalibaca caeni]
MYKMIPAFHWANSISLLGLFFAVNGIYNSLLGDLNQAMLFFVIAGICDLFDGVFAKRFKRSEFDRQMGEHVDSFVDMISFVGLPVVLLFSLVGQTPITLLVAFFYAAMSLHRLGYFHLTKEEQEGKSGSFRFFIGVPLAYIALILPILYAVFLLFGATETILFRFLVGVLYVAMGVAYVWNRPIPKPGGKMYAVFVVLAILLVALLGSR